MIAPACLARCTAALAVLLISPGCLSLGGRTTYVEERPDTAVRLSGLESRVAALEEMLSVRSAPAANAPLPLNQQAP